MTTALPILTPDIDTYGLLSRQAESVMAFDDDLLTLVQHLHDTLADVRQRYGFGRAMAAPQVGISKRVIVFNLGAMPFVMINPQLTWRSDEMQWVWDDCLSLPDTIVRVRRYASISVNYYDETGRTHHWQHLPPDMSELVLHELDHLEGRIMTDRANPEDIFHKGENITNISTRTEHRLSLNNIRLAAKSIDPIFVNTPCMLSVPLGEQLNCHVWLKDETQNPLRCFKGRGADCFISHLSPKESVRELVCASAGNWGMALAWSCQQHNIPLQVFVPENANQRKVNSIRALKARITAHGQDFDSAKEHARDYCRRTGAWLVEDGKEATISEGAATIGVELLECGQHFDAIFIPVGNGALINGIARWVKASSPDTQIIGVVPLGADAMQQSWLAGEPVNRQHVSTIADGLAVRTPVPEAVSDMQNLVDQMVMVNETQISEAMYYAENRLHQILEPSGAAGIAGLLAYAAKIAPESHIAVILTGANSDTTEDSESPDIG